MIKLSGEEQKKLEKSVEETLENPFWKKQFEDAPSEECKDYVRYTFYSSDHYDPEGEDAAAFDKLQEEVESKLSVTDWQYLKHMLPNSPFVGYCTEQICRLSKQ